MTNLHIEAELPYRTQLLYQARESGIPAHCAKSIVNYIVYGIPTGGFISAILANDLTLAVGRADPMNRYSLGAYISFLVQYAPPESWGSANKVRRWQIAGGLVGAKTDREERGRQLSQPSEKDE